MSDFTPEEFNLAMAELEGSKIAPSDDTDRVLTIKTAEPDIQYFSRVNPYSDLNQLMPIAWKYGAIQQALLCAEDVTYEAFLKAIRQCLWAIYQKTKT